jgi:hypothetical protein
VLEATDEGQWPCMTLVQRGGEGGMFFLLTLCWSAPSNAVLRLFRRILVQAMMPNSTMLVSKWLGHLLKSSKALASR